MTASHLEPFRTATITVAETPDLHLEPDDDDDEHLWSEEGHQFVPQNAAEVVDWIDRARKRYGVDAAADRARLALRVEESREKGARKTVLSAIASALDADG